MLRGETYTLKISEINPYIRRVSKHIVEGGLDTGNRINRHYQLHYIHNGVGEFEISGKSYLASKGDFFIWGPSEMHRIKSSLDSPMEVIGVQFDMTNRYSHQIYPCNHYTQEDFSEEFVNEWLFFEEIPHISHYTSIKDKRTQGTVMYLLEEVVRQFKSQNPFSKEIMSGLLKSVMLLSLEKHLETNQERNHDKKSVLEVVSYIQEHSKEKISNVDLGKMFSYHPNYLNQMVLNYTGYTIQQYLIHIRMNKAIDLLEHSNMFINEIADEVGGYSLHYFSRLFKDKIGVSPSEFRK